MADARRIQSYEATCSCSTIASATSAGDTAVVSRMRGLGTRPASYLYSIRNSLAHGKTGVLMGGHGSGFERAARALPVVKLLARVAVESP